MARAGQEDRHLRRLGRGAEGDRGPGDIQPWRLGVVLKTEATKAIVGLKPEKQQDGTLVDNREAVEIGFDEVKWAKTTDEGCPKAVTDVLSPGDVIYVAPKDSKDLGGVWSLMQVPEVGGGIVAHRSQHRPRAGRRRRVLLRPEPVRPRASRPSASPAPPSSRSSTRRPSTMDTSRRRSCSMRPSRSSRARARTSGSRRTTRRSIPPAPRRLRFGVEHSRNQMTVRLAQDLGMPLIIEYAKRFGVYDDLLPVLSMSLGAGETTLLRLATGYCMIANGGHQVRATLIDRIQDRWGHTVWRHDQRACEGCKAEAWEGQEEPEILDDRQQIIDPHTAYQMTSILEGVIQRGTAKIAAVAGAAASPARRARRTRRRTPGSSASRPTWWSACSSATTRPGPWAKARRAGASRRPSSATS